MLAHPRRAHPRCRGGPRHWRSPAMKLQADVAACKRVSCCVLGVMAKTGAGRVKRKSFCAFGTDTGSISRRMLCARRSRQSHSRHATERLQSATSMSRPTSAPLTARDVQAQPVDGAHVADRADHFARRRRAWRDRCPWPARPSARATVDPRRHRPAAGTGHSASSPSAVTSDTVDAEPRQILGDVAAHAARRDRHLARVGCARQRKGRSRGP